MLNLGTIGALNVEIGADTKSIEKALKAVGGVATGLAATLAILVKRQIDAADGFGKMGQSTSLGTAKLSEYEHMASLSDVSTQELANAVMRLNRNMLDAKFGLGEAVRGFQALGIETKRADGTLRSTDEVMEELADRFAEMEDGPGKTAIAMMLLGRSGATLIPMLNQGSAAMRKMREEAQQLGITMDDNTAKAAENFNDNLTRMHAVQKGITNQVMKEVLPVLNRFTDDMVDAAKSTDTMKVAAEAAATGVKIMLTAIVGLGAGVRIAGDSLGKLMAFFDLLRQGEFSKAFALIKEDSNDMASVIEAAVNRIKKIWEDAAPPEQAASEQKRKRKAPLIINPEELKAEVERVNKLLEEDAANWVRHAEEVMAAEEQRLLQLAEARERGFEALEGMRDMFRTEEEMEQRRFEEKIKKLQEFKQLEIITEEEFNELQRKLTAEHQLRLTQVTEKGYIDREKFARMSMKSQVKTIFSELDAITAGVSQHNKTMFELNKVAGIANAVINAYEGISLTMAKYPYPLNIAMAAAHAAAAFAQVRAISSASFGGGGGAAPSLAGATAAPPVTPMAAGGGSSGGDQITIVNFQGTTDERKLLRRFVEMLNENRRDGGGRFVLSES